MRRMRRSPNEDGVTLVELLITVVIMSMIMSAIAASFVTAFNTTRPNSDRVRQSNDAQLIAGFLVRDAQSAGGTDPSTGEKDDSIGVSTTAWRAATPTGQVARCSDSSGTTRFRCDSRSSGSKNYHDAAKEIVRKTCVGGAAESTLTLGREIATASATCNDPPTACTCPDTARTVSMHLKIHTSGQPGAVVRVSTHLSGLRPRVHEGGRRRTRKRARSDCWHSAMAARRALPASPSAAVVPTPIPM